MTGREREARRLRTLVARLWRDWTVAERIHDRLGRAIGRIADDGADEVTVGATALYLQNVYTAIEELMQRIAAEVDGSTPSGADWHRELIDQMLTEIPGVRPPVIDDELGRDLDLLRRFRHVVRHAYAEPYDWREMQDAVAAERRVVDRFPQAISRIESLLAKAIEVLEREVPTDTL